MNEVWYLKINTLKRRIKKYHKDQNSAQFITLVRRRSLPLALPIILILLHDRTDRDTALRRAIPRISTMWHIAIITTLLDIAPTAQFIEGACSWCHGALQAAHGTRGAGQLLEFPHVLPLLLGGHFIVVGRGRGPFFLFGALGFAFGGVSLLFCSGGDKGVD
jgi:hypothetical protein